MNTHSRKVRMPRPQRPQHEGVPALEWVREVSGKTARVTAVGSRRLLIENHTGILTFTDETVSLSTACGPLNVCGRGLSLCEVRENALIVQGCICRVELPEEGGPR